MKNRQASLGLQSDENFILVTSYYHSGGVAVSQVMVTTIFVNSLFKSV